MQGTFCRRCLDMEARTECAGPATVETRATVLQETLPEASATEESIVEMLGWTESRPKPLTETSSLQLQMEAETCSRVEACGICFGGRRPSQQTWMNAWCVLNVFLSLVCW